MNDMARNLILWVIIAVVLMSVFNNFSSHRESTQNTLEYSRFIADVKRGEVAKVIIQGPTIIGQRPSGEQFKTVAPEDAHLIDDLLENNVVIKVEEPEQRSLLMQIFISWFPMMVFIGVWIFFIRQMQSGGAGRGAMSFGKSKARMLSEGTFASP
ncbi:MAG TPA: ATP-dependent metalloprotease, partial [Gammaproteobacteria bacterium]|nr:ATP-dependent metalloprotease [Gammaproteobacteria bacterium]